MLGEIQLIREQMKSDFDFMVKAFARQRDSIGDVRNATDEVRKAVEEIGKALVRQQQASDELQTALENHIVRTEDKFDRLIAIVAGQEERLEKVEEQASVIPSMETRLRALESGPEDL